MTTAMAEPTRYEFNEVYKVAADPAPLPPATPGLAYRLRTSTQSLPRPAGGCAVQVPDGSAYAAPSSLSSPVTGLKTAAVYARTLAGLPSFVTSVPFCSSFREQAWPRDPVHFDRGANDLTGESVSFSE